MTVRAHPMAFRRLIAFRSFRHCPDLPNKRLPGVAENDGKQSRLAILAVTDLRWRALSSICDNQQSTHAPLILRNKRNPETRARGLRHVGTWDRIIPTSLGQCRMAWGAKPRDNSDTVATAEESVLVPKRSTTPIALTQGRASQHC